MAVRRPYFDMAPRWLPRPNSSMRPYDGLGFKAGNKREERRRLLQRVNDSRTRDGMSQVNRC